MKLVNQSIGIIAVFVLGIIGLWAVIFYYSMIGEIKESVDEGLSNYKRQIIYRAHQDTALLKQVNFNEGFYAIRQISQNEALAMRDIYKDTLIYIRKGNDDTPEAEPFRMLTTAFEDDGLFFELRVINSMVEREDLINQLFKTTIWLYMVLIVSILFINNFVLRRVWRPFYHFLGQLKNFRLGRSDSFPTVKTKTREFIDLQDATHTLLRHNTASFEQQKQFIGNAAHELQTPLAIALNKLELLLEKGGLEDGQVEDIGDTMAVIERLIRLNKSLLLLTKIENHQFLERQIVSFNQIVSNGVQELEEMAAFRGIRFSIRGSAALSAEMDPSLAEIFVFNLLRNAVFYSKDQAFITVNIRKKEIQFINDGEKSLDATTIFNRFQKPSRDSGGSGLGLSIVKAIADLYDFDISYSFQHGQHYFVVRVR